VKIFSFSREEKYEDIGCDVGVSWSFENWANSVPAKETIELLSKMNMGWKKPGRTIMFWFWFHTPYKTYTLTIDLSYNYNYDWTEEEIANAKTLDERRKLRRSRKQ